MSEEPVQERWRRGMASCLGELEQLYTKDEIGAVSISIALRDGNVRTLKCYDAGFRVLLISAAAIALKEATEFAPVERDPDNWFVPGPAQGG